MFLTLALSLLFKLTKDLHLLSLLPLPPNSEIPGLHHGAQSCDAEVQTQRFMRLRQQSANGVVTTAEKKKILSRIIFVQWLPLMEGLLSSKYYGLILKCLHLLYL